MSVPKALEVKEELEKIDELLKQLEEAEKNGQIGLIDMEMLSEFAQPGDMEQLEEMRQQVETWFANKPNARDCSVTQPASSS